MADTVYRLILYTPEYNGYQTGATYPGCDRVNNPDLCDPKGFANESDAVQYAYDHIEVPVKVTSLAQIDGILNGSIQVTPDMIYGTLSGDGGSTAGGLFEGISTPVLLAGAALIALLVFGKKKRGS